MADDDSRRENEEDDARADGGDDAARPGNVVNYRSAPPPARGGGFFSIYKKGQGYWTRMGTALSAGLIALLFTEFVYSQLTAIPWSKDVSGNPLYISKKICAAVALSLLALVIIFAWRAMNKPSHVDFLIATDSEMKKVNWTTRKELIGSTKVVIFFVMLIALILFALDLVFGYFFQLIKVLEFGPFQ